MSIAPCKKCGCLIDTDENPECYYIELADGTEKELDDPLCYDCKENEQ